MNAPAVTCICVTRNRVELLRRAVHCFLQQTYAARELLIVWESDDVATRTYVETLRHHRIRLREIPAVPRQTLGALRNQAVQGIQTPYFAQWDDDDWHAPARLSAQLAAMHASSKPACVLARWLMFDVVTGNAYVSRGRRWEGSLACEQAFAPTYAALAKGEDLPAIEQLWQMQRLTLLDRPDLYIYVHHGSNTWDRSHWLNNILPLAQALPAEVSRKICDVLAGRGQFIVQP